MATVCYGFIKQYDWKKPFPTIFRLMTNPEIVSKLLKSRKEIGMEWWNPLQTLCVSNFMSLCHWVLYTKSFKISRWFIGKQKNVFLKFQVVKFPPNYNGLVGKRGKTALFQGHFGTCYKTGRKKEEKNRKKNWFVILQGLHKQNFTSLCHLVWSTHSFNPFTDDWAQKTQWTHLLKDISAINKFRSPYFFPSFCWLLIHIICEF